MEWTLKESWKKFQIVVMPSLDLAGITPDPFAVMISIAKVTSPL